MDLFGQLEIDVAVEEDIDFVVELAGADVFVADINIGDFALVERVADPADGVGVGPGDPDAEARCFGGVMRNIGNGEGGGEVEAELIGDLVKRLGKTGLGWKNPGAGRVFRAVCLERAFGDFEIEIGQPVASGEEAFLSRVLEDEHGAGAGDFAARLGSFGKRAE